MKRLQAVSKNAAALVTAKLVNSGLTLLLAIVINRQIGPVNAGIYTFAFTMYTIFQVLPDFGMGNISIRDVSQDRSKLPEYLRNVVLLRIILGIAALLLLMAVNGASFLFSSSADAATKFWSVGVIAFSLLVEQPFANTLAEAFVALEKFSYVALVYLDVAILKVAISVYILTRGLSATPTLVFLMLTYIGTQAYAVAHFYWLYRRKAPALISEAQPEDAAEEVLAGALALEGPVGEAVEETAAVEPDGKPLWKYLLINSWPLAIATGGLALYAGIDVPILSWLKGDEQVGLYGAAIMFAKSFMFLTIAINMAMLPAVARAYHGSREVMGNLWERLMRYALIITVPLMVVVPLLARPVLVLQKHEFITALPAVWITMGAMVFTFMYAMMYPFFVTINAQRALTWLVLAGIAVKIAANLILIPLWGFKGAAVAMLVSEMVMFGMTYVALTRRLQYRIKFVQFAGVPVLLAGLLYAGVALGGRALITGSGAVPSFLSAVVAAVAWSAAVLAVYIVGVILTRLVSKRGLQELNDLLELAKPEQPAAEIVGEV